jgi:protein-S-isoprenylcysteine O-methyltransferase Ste14
MTGRADNDGVVMFPPGVYFAGLAIGFAAWWVWPTPIVPAGLADLLRDMGIVAIALGVAIAFWALYVFWRARTTPTHWEPTTALAFGGPYRLTRNPMYVGMTLGHAGIALGANALWPLLTLVPVLVIIRTQVIAREEAYLMTKFGDAYRDFTGRVRRWL